jgi:hypothetical protein
MSDLIRITESFHRGLSTGTVSVTLGETRVLKLRAAVWWWRSVGGVRDGGISNPRKYSSFVRFDHPPATFAYV